MKKFCEQCGKEMDYTVRQMEETYPVKGKATTIVAEVCVCSGCGTTLWDEELDDANLVRAYNAYRKTHGLLTHDEIKAIREQYGLSQASFARILGFGEKTITRYEGGSLQDEAHNNLMLLARDPWNFCTLWQRVAVSFSGDERRRVEARLRELGVQIAFSSILYEREQPQYVFPQNIANRSDTSFFAA